MKKFFWLMIFLLVVTSLTMAQPINPEDDIDTTKSLTEEPHEDMADSLEFDRLEKVLNELTTMRQQVDELNLSMDNKTQNIQAAIESLQNNLDAINKSTKSLQVALPSLEKSLSSQLSGQQALIVDAQSRIDQLKSETDQTSALLQQVQSALENKISTNAQTAENKILTLNKDLSRTTRNWIAAAVVLALFSLSLFVLLRKKLVTEKTGLATRIQDTRRYLEEESIKLDNKLTELLEKQLELSQRSQQAASNETQQIDHSLALKVADEIVRIQKNLKNMDPEIKGIKQLAAAVRRIQDNFEAQGYEMVEMLGKYYNEGMKVLPTFIPDEKIKQGEKIITRIIKPTVNYRGVMIQSGQVEVSINE
jgi:chromosome segregation ATPase